MQTLDDVDKIVHLESVFKTNLDEISQRIFEDPKFDDRIYIHKSVEKSEIISFPRIAYFEDVFSYIGKLYLNLRLLSENELKELIK